MRRLARALMLCGAVLWAGHVWAQDPRVSVTAEQKDVMVGQPVLVRVEVLVPTFMPRAPIFPTFEIPGVIVRLPERSTVPISESVGGVTWAGVRRTYRIYPMRAGLTDIPAQQLDIVYRDVQTNSDISLTIEVPAMRINATVPVGARALSPLILARGLKVEQVWEGSDGELSVGDAVVRKLELSIEGASALFVPPLLEAAPPRPDMPEGAEFSAYPEDALVTERFEQGVMSGMRTEQVSYIARSGGTATFPDITVSWYNIISDRVEEVILPGREFTVAMPAKVHLPMDRSEAIRSVLIAMLVGLSLWVARRWLWSPLKARAQALRTIYDGTPLAVHRTAEARAKARDLNGVFNALVLREARGLPVGKTLRTNLQALSQALYGTPAGRADTNSLWAAVERALRHERPGLLSRTGRVAEDLPPLNPFTANRK